MVSYTRDSRWNGVYAAKNLESIDRTKPDSLERSGSCIPRIDLYEQSRTQSSILIEEGSMPR